MRILLVDDNDSVRLTLSAIFEDAGHVVTEAHSLASARRCLQDDAGFDLILLDLHLTDGLGTSLIPEARAVLPSSTIAILTGDSAPVAGADVVLVKGDDPMRMLEQVERAVAS